MLKLLSISKIYENRCVLKNISYNFKKGLFYVIVGPSGEGKTTLLSIMSGIESYDSGHMEFCNQKVTKDSLGSYRAKNSIVFQQYNLINYLNPIENLKVVLSKHKTIKNEGITNAAKKYLNQVGITEELQTISCNKLSGGQQQRVAVARAIAQDCDIVFADEPTGNLDSNSGSQIITLLKELVDNNNKTVICVTHSPNLMKSADVILELKDGKLKKK